MLKRGIIAVVAVFAVLQILGMTLHMGILGGIYEATPDLWRPEAEMKMGLMLMVTLIQVIAFVAIYVKLIGNRGIVTGLRYGVLYGVGIGIGMGYGTYSTMPIPYSLALGWFLGTLVIYSIAGLVLGLVVKGDSAAAAAATPGG